MSASTRPGAASPVAAARAMTHRSPWTLAWGLAAVVLVAVSIMVPGRAVVVLALAEGGAALVAAVVLHRRGLLRSRVGGSLVGVLALLSCSSAALTVIGPGAWPGLALIVVAQVVGLGGCLPAFTAHERPSGTLRRGHVLSAEVAIVVVGTGLAVGQTFLRADRLGADLPASVAAAVDLLGLAVLGWLLLTRRRLLPVVALGTIAACLLMTQNYLATSRGTPLGSAAELGQPLGVLGALLLGAALTHPSLATLVAGRYRPRLRSGGARLTVVIPFACMPALSWLGGVLDPQSAVPAVVLVTTAVGISLLALVTAFGLVAEMEAAADADPLTGHLGRLGATRRLEDLHAARTPTVVVLVDVDDFTDVNQRHGPEVGDAVLVAALDRLVDRLPEGSVVARLAGDEMLALLPDDGPGTAERAGELVRSLFAEPFDLPAARVQLAVSVGVTGLLERPDGQAGDALVDADIAQRLAKARGGDRCVAYDGAVRDEVMEPVHLLRDLRSLLAPADEHSRPTTSCSASAQAVPAGVGHLVVHYQPIVDVATGDALSVEALVRWSHPHRGTVAPDEFLPLAELGGVGATLDRAVMTQALRQLAEWDAGGLGVTKVSVNLGSASMREGGLWTFAVAACRDAGVEVHRLALEITEHDALDVDDGVIDDLLALRDAGADVALDDFGAGHASVGYLRRWPANVVKLDRSLLPSASPPAGHEAMLDARPLLQAVAQMVHTLDRSLLVEGVEDEEDLALVRSLGAQRAQGYHFSRPLPADDLARWWRSRPCQPSPDVVSPATLVRDQVT